MNLRKITIFILISFMFSGTVSAGLGSIKLFNIIEFNFYNTGNNEELIECDELCSNSDKTEEIKVEEKEIVFPEDVIISDPIYKTEFVNDKLYIYISDLNFKISSNILYINGYKIKDKLTKERYYSDENYNVYSIDEDDVLTYIFEGYNKIYFKNEKTDENTISYYFYYGDLFNYDGVTNLINCNGLIDRITLTNGNGEIVYDKLNQGKYHNIIYKRDNEELLKGYYSSKIYCSNEISELYFIGNFNFYYNSRYEQATHYTSYGEYFDKYQYNILKK